MKTFYSNWNKETLDDSVIVKDLLNMSQGKLVLDLEKVREDNLFEKLYRERKTPRPGGDNREGGGRDNNRNRNNPRFNKNRRSNNPQYFTTNSSH